MLTRSTTALQTQSNRALTKCQVILPKIDLLLHLRQQSKDGRNIDIKKKTPKHKKRVKTTMQERTKGIRCKNCNIWKDSPAKMNLHQPGCDFNHNVRYALADRRGTNDVRCIHCGTTYTNDRNFVRHLNELYKCPNIAKIRSNGDTPKYLQQEKKINKMISCESGQLENSEPRGINQRNGKQNKDMEPKDAIEQTDNLHLLRAGPYLEFDISDIECEYMNSIMNRYTYIGAQVQTSVLAQIEETQNNNIARTERDRNGSTSTSRVSLDGNCTDSTQKISSKHLSSKANCKKQLNKKKLASDRTHLELKYDLENSSPQQPAEPSVTVSQLVQETIGGIGM